MNKKFLIPAIICLILCLVCLYLYLRPGTEPEPPIQTPKPTEQPESITAENTPEPASEEMEASSEEPEPQEPYVSPIDFSELQEQNPDIYAWLSVEGTQISYPVVQCYDDTYYLDHNIDGEYTTWGSIFTESAYNDDHFEDQITVVYGHRMKSGAMFGTLQPEFSSMEQLDEHNEIIIYLPEQELHYQIFAAVPYDARHILYNYGDGTAGSMLSFLFSVSGVRALDAVIDREAFATKEDRIIVLSTCLYGNISKRFIVVGKLIQE